MLMDEEEREEKKQALRRYEDARREHLGVATNVTFGLAAAGVGFCASLLTGKDAQALTYPGNYFFLAAMVLFVIAVGLSMLITWVRLQDFRLTARKLRLEPRGDQHSSKVAKRADFFGKLTWAVYRFQLASFGCAVLSLAISLWLQFRTRIFP